MSHSPPTSHPPEPIPASESRRRRPSLASLKTELHQRLLTEDAAVVADDLLARAKAGDLLAVQLLLAYTIGPPADVASEDADAVLAEPALQPETATEPAANATAAAVAPPADSKRVVAPSSLTALPTNRAAAAKTPTRSVARAPVLDSGVGAPSANGWLSQKRSFRMDFPANAGDGRVRGPRCDRQQTALFGEGPPNLLPERARTRSPPVHPIG